MLVSFVISFFPVFFLFIFTLFMISYFFNWDIITNRFKKLFFIGMLNFIIAKFIVLLIHFFYKINYDKIPLFFYLWISEILVLTVFLLFTYKLLIRWGLLRPDSYREYSIIFSYSSGFFALTGLTKVIGSQLKLDSYIIFIYPLVSLILLILYSIILIEAGTKRDYKSYLLYSLLLPLSLLLALIPWLYYINYIQASYGLTFISLIGSFVAFYLLKKDYIRS